MFNYNQQSLQDIPEPPGLIISITQAIFPRTPRPRAPILQQRHILRGMAHTDAVVDTLAASSQK
jgi:hypothetical protein